MSQFIFISVGRTFTPTQEAFVTAVETYLRSQGFEPRTIGRNYFRNDQPLKIITQCMQECVGVMIIAFERIHIVRGIDQPGSQNQREISGVNLTTVWNQIEAAMAYSYGRPLLVLEERGLKSEGLLETGYDWWVQSVTLDQSTLANPEFIQIFNDWKMTCSQTKVQAIEPIDPTKLSLWKLFIGLNVPQAWALLGGLIALISGIAAIAYWIGTKTSALIGH